MSDNNNKIGHNTTSAGGKEENIMDVSATWKARELTHKYKENKKSRNVVSQKENNDFPAMELKSTEYSNLTGKGSKLTGMKKLNNLQIKVRNTIQWIKSKIHEQHEFFTKRLNEKEPNRNAVAEEFNELGERGNRQHE